MGKYKLTWKDLSWKDFKIYLFALFKAFIPKKKLDNLLTKTMTENFYKAIEDRNNLKISSELTFIGMKESDLEKYEKVKTNLFATVKFVSEIISVTRDENNKIIEGNPDRIKTVTDHWKFTKNTFSKSPNWHLSEIISK